MHFSSRKIPADALVFLPFGSRKKAYFVDSKADEEKIRSFVKMYRSASTLISWLAMLGIYAFGWSWTYYASASPLRNKLTGLVVSSLVYLLFLLLWTWILWGVYKQTVPSFTSSLSEVGPDLQGQLSEISLRPRRLALVFVFAGIVLLAVGILGATRYSPSKHSCPPKCTSPSR